MRECVCMSMYVCACEYACASVRVCASVCVGGAQTWSLQLDHGYKSLTPVLPADALDKAGLKGSLRLSFMSGVETISHSSPPVLFRGKEEAQQWRPTPAPAPSEDR